MVANISPKTGQVFVRNFDQGVVETLGGSVQSLPDGSIKGNRRGYYITIPTSSPMLVPIIFNNPEQIYESKIYPSFLVARESIEPALNRWQSVKQLEYMAGVSGTEEVISGVSGFAQLESKVQAWPFDMFYTISCFAKNEHESMPMLKTILRVFKTYSRINLIDSLGDSRSYTAFAESGVQDISEYSDVADRVKAYAVSIRVEAELDLDDPVISSTVSGVQNSLGNL